VFEFTQFNVDLQAQFEFLELCKWSPQLNKDDDETDTNHFDTNLLFSVCFKGIK